MLSLSRKNRHHRELDINLRSAGCYFNACAVEHADGCCRRCFDGFLAHLIRIRDGDRCRDPYCGAPARHLDHIVTYRAGGPTTLANGRGACARGNYVREMPGWDVHLDHDGLADIPHTITVTTPTGHTYPSRAGPPC